MNNFSWGKAFGFAALIWLIMFVLATIAAVSGMGLGMWSMFVLAIIAGFVAYGFSVNAGPANAGQAFGYGVIFAAVGLVLDAIISYQLQPAIFATWSYWAGYLLILFVPLTAVGSHQTTTHSHA